MKMKKNYITPQIAVFTCNSESLLAGSGGMTSGGSDNTGGGAGLGNNGNPENGGAGDLSKDNSGLLDWDDEEE